MDLLATTPPDTPATMRCECGACGVHVVLRFSWQISGQCRNCRSYDLRRVTPVAPVATADWLGFEPRTPIIARRRSVA